MADETADTAFSRVGRKGCSGNTVMFPWRAAPHGTPVTALLPEATARQRFCPPKTPSQEERVQLRDEGNEPCASDLGRKDIPV